MSTMRIGVGFDVDVLKQSRFQTTLSSLDVLLFPELMDGGYAALKKGKLPHSLDNEFVTSLKKASASFSCTIVVGAAFKKDGTLAATNTALIFARGKLLHRYDKIHLFKPTGDTKFFSPGQPEATTFDIATRATKVRAGAVICYD